MNICPSCHPDDVMKFGPAASYALCDKHFQEALTTPVRTLKLVKKEPTHG